MLYSLELHIPLGLPVDKPERRVEKEAHLRQCPLLVDSHEKVGKSCALEGHLHRLPFPVEDTVRLTIKGTAGREHSAHFSTY